MEKLNMTINGKAISVDVDPGIRLVDFLRDNLFLPVQKSVAEKASAVHARSL